MGLPKLSLPPLPTMREIIKLYGLSAKKKLAQNFIMDLNLTEKIAMSGGSLLNSTVIEVGPGPGSLTRSILQLGARKVIVVEKDRRFLPALEVLQQAAGQDRMEIVIGDMLEEDEGELVKKLGAVHPNYLEEISEEDRWKMNSPVKIIGNLPFNVGTLLLFKWLHQLPTRKGSFIYGRTPLVLLYQEEVADRIVAKPGTKAYSRLSVMVQQSCHATKKFRVDRKSFVPAPEVNAAVVEVVPRTEPLAEVKSQEALEFVTRELIGQRRKVLSNSVRRLGLGIGPELLQLSGIDPTLRSEQLTVREFCRIADVFTNLYGVPSLSHPIQRKRDLERIEVENWKKEIEEGGGEDLEALVPEEELNVEGLLVDENGSTSDSEGTRAAESQTTTVASPLKLGLSRRYRPLSPPTPSVKTKSDKASY